MLTLRLLFLLLHQLVQEDGERREELFAGGDDVLWREEESEAVVPQLGSEREAGSLALVVVVGGAGSGIWW